MLGMSTGLMQSITSVKFLRMHKYKMVYWHK